MKEENQQLIKNLGLKHISERVKSLKSLEETLLLIEEGLERGCEGLIEPIKYVSVRIRISKNQLNLHKRRIIEIYEELGWRSVTFKYDDRGDNIDYHFCDIEFWAH